MFTALEMSSFRAFKHARLELKPLNLIVGPNASGKTSVLMALAYLGNWLGAERGKLRLRWDDLQCRGDGSVAAPVTALTAEWPGHPESRRATLRFSTRTSGGPSLHEESNHERLPPDGLIASPFESDSWARESTYSRHNPNGGNGWMYCTAPLFVRLSPSALAMPGSSDAVTDVAEFDGTGLPSLLVDLATNQPKLWELLRDTLRRIVPNIKNVFLARKPLDKPSLNVPSPGREIIVDTENAKGLPASSVSEGTLIALGLLAITYTRRNPTVLLIDELERGLHPRALKDVVEHLRRIVAEMPDMQIVATTHSPYLVDCFKPEEIHVTGLLPDGSATIAPLTSAPDFDRWKDQMLPGELWSSIGEEWVALAAAVNAPKAP